MTERVLTTATLCAVVGCGLMAGLFFIFSVAIMPALAKLPAAQGVAAMNSINAVIVNPIFLLVFVGSSLLCLALAVTAPFIGQPGAALRIVGGLLLFVGAFVVTRAANIPLNDTLAGVDPTSADAAAQWQHYQGAWNPWNHVRTLTSIGATVCMALALRV